MRLQFDHDWHTGETAAPFECVLLLRDGITPRDDVTSATFKLVNMNDPAHVLIPASECAVSGGTCTYYPTAAQIGAISTTLAQDIRALGQFVATLDDGTVAKSPLIECRVRANV